MFRVDRKEFKFVIPLAQRDEVVGLLEDRVSADVNAGLNAHYPIVSQYYDSSDKSCYWEKQEGLKHRRKLRVRVYGEKDGGIPPTVFIEVKAKSFRRGVKRRLQMPLAAAVALAEGKTDVYEALNREPCRAERMVVGEIADLVSRRKFVPSVAIRYDRLAFQSAIGDGDLRVTFDYDLRCRFRNVPLAVDCDDFDDYLLDRDLCIMEVKTTAAVPFWLCQMFAKLKLRPRSFSKYCTSIERFDPAFVA